MQACGLSPLPATAVFIKTNPCPHKFEGHGFYVSILFGLSTDSRFDAHRFKASKLTQFSPSVIATSRADTFLVRGRQPHPPLRGTFPTGEGKSSTFLFYSNLSLIHVLMPIDSRHQNLRGSLLPSKPIVLPPSSSEEGLFWAPPDGGAVSGTLTEGEKPLDRCTNAVFLP